MKQEKDFMWAAGGVLLVIALLLAAAAGYARGAEPPSCDIEVGRLIIDQTRTRVGLEFAQRFCSLWEDLPGQKTEYTVVIKEAPSVRYGSTIIVELNDIVAYRAILRTRSEDIEQAARTATQNIRLLLLQLEQQRINGTPLEMEEEL